MAKVKRFNPPKRPNVLVDNMKALRIVEEEQKRRESELLGNALLGLTSAFVISLHDECGFGKKRITQVLNRVNKQYEQMRDGYITMEDLVKWVEDYGVSIR